MHLAIHPARSGVPAHSQALLAHHGQIPPKRRIHVPLQAPPKQSKYLPLEQKYAAMRAKMERLREKGIIE